MAKEALTDKQVKHMKPGDKQVEIPAGPPKGLYLVVHRNGRKTWRFRYRYRGRTRGLMFPKPYPEMILAAARAEANAAVEKLDEGLDPAEVQAEEIRQETPESIESVAKEWIKRYVKTETGERSQAEYERILNKEVLPMWKGKLVTEIRKPDVLRVIDALVDREAPALAKKTLAIIKAWFTWLEEDRGYIDQSPAAGIRGPSLESRERVLENDELLEIWNTVGALGYPAGPFLQVLVLTAQRRGEVATMRWRDLNLKAALWTIPAEKMKGARTHLVPLSAAAVAIIEKLPRFKEGDFVFTTTSGELAINGFSKLKERIDGQVLERRQQRAVEANANPKKVKNLEDWTLHDIRRTATTRMAGLQVLPHVLSAVLGHSTAVTVSTKPSAAVTKIYNQYNYIDEKRQALEVWAQYVLSLGKPATKAASA